MNFKMLAAGIAAAIVIASVATDRAAAATYTYDFSYNLATQTCSTSGVARTCYEYHPLPAGTFGNKNDQFNVDVSVADGGTLVVPGSNDENIVFVDLYDNQYLSGGTQTDTALGVSSSVNYMALGTPAAPAYPIGSPPIPLTLSDNYIYESILGFCCNSGAYGLPNDGFSLTGVDATLTLQNSDPNPLSFILVGTYVGVPEPATWATMLAGFFGLGAMMRSRRSKPATAAA